MDNPFAMCLRLQLTRQVPIQSHLAALEFQLPPTLHLSCVVRRGRCSRHFKDRNLIITWITALERHVSTVACLEVLLPTPPEAFFTFRRANILVSCSGACQQ